MNLKSEPEKFQKVWIEGTRSNDVRRFLLCFVCLVKVKRYFLVFPKGGSVLVVASAG